MSLRRSPTRTAKSPAANAEDTGSSLDIRQEAAKHPVTGQMKRDYKRLMGFSEALTLDLEPGAAIHLYHELIAPYKQVPPLLAMHFRDLARLQLELQAWEGIRDAEMQHRAEQTAIKERRQCRDRDREVGATAKDVYQTGLYRLPDSPGKLRHQYACLAALKGALQEGVFDDIKGVLTRLYGEDLWPDHERGQLICIECQRLMDPENLKQIAARLHVDAEQLPAPLTEDGMQALIKRVEEEKNDVMSAWELALIERTLTDSAKRARLAPTREDHWMNRQGDRLRMAIDRKMRFTVTLLNALGLADPSQPTPRRRHRKKPRGAPRQTRNVTTG